MKFALVTALFATVLLATVDLATGHLATALASNHVKPEKVCYVQISKETEAAEKECLSQDAATCSKDFKNCKWASYDRKCHGVMFALCSNGTLPNCENGVNFVAEFPANLVSTNLKFRCEETSPVRVSALSSLAPAEESTSKK